MWIPTLLPSEATRWLTWQKVGRPSGSGVGLALPYDAHPQGLLPGTCPV